MGLKSLLSWFHAPNASHKRRFVVDADAFMILRHPWSLMDEKSLFSIYLFSRLREGWRFPLEPLRFDG